MSKLHPLCQQPAETFGCSEWPAALCPPLAATPREFRRGLCSCGCARPCTAHRVPNRCDQPRLETTLAAGLTVNEVAADHFQIRRVCLYLRFYPATRRRVTVFPSRLVHLEGAHVFDHVTDRCQRLDTVVSILKHELAVADGTAII